MTDSNIALLTSTLPYARSLNVTSTTDRPRTEARTTPQRHACAPHDATLLAPFSAKNPSTSTFSPFHPPDNGQYSIDEHRGTSGQEGVARVIN